MPPLQFAKLIADASHPPAASGPPAASRVSVTPGQLWKTGKKAWPWVSTPVAFVQVAQGATTEEVTHALSPFFPEAQARSISDTLVGFVHSHTGHAAGFALVASGFVVLVARLLGLKKHAGAIFTVIAIPAFCVFVLCATRKPLHREMDDEPPRFQLPIR
jgi:hypothetical protein